MGATIKLGIADLVALSAYRRVVGQASRDITKDVVHATIPRVFTLRACPRGWDARGDCYRNVGELFGPQRRIGVAVGVALRCRETTSPLTAQLSRAGWLYSSFTRLVVTVVSGATS